MSFKTAATFGLGKELVDQKQMQDELTHPWKFTSEFQNIELNFATWNLRLPDTKI
jgi:hypothetical protein